MKKIITLFLFTTLLNVVKAQISDTLQYVKTFEQQKAQYIGQPFSVLLTALGQVQPKSVWEGRNFRNKNQIPYCTFHFVVPNDVFKTVGVICMRIDWQTAIPLQNIEYYSNRNHYFFTSEEQQFYGTKLIKDISVYMSK